MYDPTSCEASRNATFSPVSGSGLMHSDAQGGPTTDPSGLAAVLANLSAKLAKELGLLTSGTYGPPSIGSSSSAALQSSLESRLRASLPGSTLYKLTWKQWVMPSGVSRSRLRASVLRTSETGLIGWPTPQARDHFPAHGPEYIAAKKAQGHGMANLNDVVQLAGWATPTANPPGGTPEAHIRRKLNMGRAHATVTDLAMQARYYLVSGAPATGSPAETGNLGQLNPALSRWLMGLPEDWDKKSPGYDQWLLLQEKIESGDYGDMETP